MTNPSEKPKQYKIKICWNYSTSLVEMKYVWQVRVTDTENSPLGYYVKFESDDWNKAMTYGNELARILNG